MSTAMNPDTPSVPTVAVDRDDIVVIRSGGTRVRFAPETDSLDTLAADLRGGLADAFRAGQMNPGAMPNTFTVTFATDNDAFAINCRAEVVDLIRKVADAVERGGNQGYVLDSNGNTVGRYALVD